MNKVQMIPMLLKIIADAAAHPEQIESHEDWQIIISEKIGNAFVNAMLDVIDTTPSKLFDQLYMHLVDALPFPEDRFWWNCETDKNEVKWDTATAHALAKKLATQTPQYWKNTLNKNNLAEFVQTAIFE